jgi:GMP synthase (glutamine-hydrolysing)
MTRSELLILDNALDPSFYRPAEHWERFLDFRPDAVRVSSGDALPDPGAYRHVILSGSEQSVTALPEWGKREIAWVREAARAGTRILGSCFGHQVLAAALGGMHCVRKAAAPEFGWRNLSVIDDGGLLPAQGFSAFCSHFDEVVIGSHPELMVLAKTSDCPVHAFRFGKLPAFGIQSHPEIDEETARRFLRGAISRWPKQAQVFQAALLSAPKDTKSAKAILDRFLLV